jgi:hypothetical protein
LRALNGAQASSRFARFKDFSILTSLIAFRQIVPVLITLALNVSLCSMLHAQTQKTAAPRNFAVDVTAAPPSFTPSRNAAALVDGHVIPMNEVVALCLRNERSYVVDQMVQDYVVDRECAKRSIIVSDADIDKAVAALRQSIAPSTLEQQIADHHSSMVYVRNAFKEKYERIRLVEDQVPSAKIVHCCAIVIPFDPAGMPQAIAGTVRSESQARDIITNIQKRLSENADFGDLANEFSENVPKNNNGDIGMVYFGMANTDPKITSIAISLIRGETYASLIKVNNEFMLLHAVSTVYDHPKEEEPAYQAATKSYKEQQAEFLYPQLVVSLINKSKLAFTLDADKTVLSGKPLPDSAAVVDGHSIPMDTVVRQCVDEDGPEVVDTLVQNYLVDTECQKRNIVISDAQIDARLASLRKQIAPHTIDEGLRARNQTMESLRYDFKQDIERSSLVVTNIPAIKISRCQAITIRYVSSANVSISHKSAGRTEAQALTLMGKILTQLNKGGDFGMLANRYSEATPKDKNGDIGMLYAAMNHMETPMLDAGLALNRGEYTVHPVKIIDAYCLVKVLSTSLDHPTSEDKAYAAAIASYRLQRAPMVESAEIVKLVKQANVTYYMHS